MADAEFIWPSLQSEPLCVADFRVDGPILNLGRSPYSERRVGYITGGSFSGARMKGEILPGGGNWSLAGSLGDGVACGAFDARSLWQTHDGAMISVTYSGRSVVSDPVAKEFRDPAAPDVDPARYYIRIAPVFETSDERYRWLNGVMAIGRGQRMSWGIRHWVFAIL